MLVSNNCGGDARGVTCIFWCDAPGGFVLSKFQHVVFELLNPLSVSLLPPSRVRFRPTPQPPRRSFGEGMQPCTHCLRCRPLAPVFRRRAHSWRTEELERGERERERGEERRKLACSMLKMAAATPDCTRAGDPAAKIMVAGAVPCVVWATAAGVTRDGVALLNTFCRWWYPLGGGEEMRGTREESSGRERGRGQRRGGAMGEEARRWVWPTRGGSLERRARGGCWNVCRE